MSKYTLSFILLLSLAFISTANTAEIKDYGPIKDGDSLWAIAKLLRPDDSYSVSRMMNLLFTYNPQAFINGNIDRLKKGAMVRVPDHLLSSSSKVISRSESITQSSQTTSVTPSKPVSVLQKPHPPKESTLDDKQKILAQNTIETDLKAKIATLMKNNAAKDHEIASLRRDLMALRQTGSKSMPMANASNTRQVQLLETSGQESSKSSTVRSEQVESESLPSKSDMGVAHDYVTSEKSESLFGKSEIDAIKIILFVGLGLGTFVLVIGMGIMWYQRTLLVKPPVKVSVKKPGKAQSTSHSAKQPGEHSIKRTTELLTTADSELAKGNVQQAKSILQQALARDPHRADIKLRVMRIQHGQKRQHTSAILTSNSAPPLSENLGSATDSEITGQISKDDDAKISDYRANRKVSESFKDVLQKMETWRVADEVDYGDIDEAETKLELARAYIDKGNMAYAQRILNEVILEGTRSQQENASNLIVQCKTRVLKLG